jgi:GxxExxY protein
MKNTTEESQQGRHPSSVGEGEAASHGTPREADRGDLTGKAIAAAIEVHKALGPGFLESTYEEALCLELREAGVPFERQQVIPIRHRGCQVGEHRLDLLISERLVVELKACSSLERVHFAIVRSYMKAVGTDLGLLINFSSMPLTIKRVAPERIRTENNASGTHEESSGTHE